MMKVISYAPDAFRSLNGFFCVYKPSGLFGIQIRKTLVINMMRDLNLMETRPPKDLVVFDGSVISSRPLKMKVVQNFADHSLVVGHRYQPQDVRCVQLNDLGKKTSGVLLYAVNEAFSKAKAFREKNYVQVLEVKGKFGFSTDTFFHDGKVLEKSTYHHIRQHMLDRTLASIQASHQSEAFKYSGVHIESEEAFKLASHGIIRPKGKSDCILFNICCTHFSLPDFTLKIHCVNGTEDYLSKLIHEIGIYMKSCAVCCQLRQIQFGHFTLDFALLRKHWTLEHILSNIILCKKLSGLELISPTECFIQPIKKNEVDKVLLEMQKQVMISVLD